MINKNEICIRPRFVVWTGDEYEISGFPGVGLCSLNVHGPTHTEDFEHYAKIARTAGELTVQESCSIHELKRMTLERLEVSVCSASDSVTNYLFLGSGEELCRCDKEDVTIGQVLSWFVNVDMPYALVRLSRVAGEKFRGEIEGVRFDLRTREQGHNKPHVHVDYHHDAQLVIDILTGEVLEAQGRFPRKAKQSALALIEERSDDLIKWWNADTDGVKFDVNVGMGIRKLTIASV